MYILYKTYNNSRKILQYSLTATVTKHLCTQSLISDYLEIKEKKKEDCAVTIKWCNFVWQM